LEDIFRRPPVKVVTVINGKQVDSISDKTFPSDKGKREIIMNMKLGQENAKIFI
jgi:hypothetical protein